MTRPGLLVSVRSAAEALSAVAGGAAVVDVKEPDHGALGMADPSVWKLVRQVVPRDIPVSVALGELREWVDRPGVPPSAFEGIAFRKIGLAGAGPRWAEDWTALRDRMGDGPAWIAVIYADWREAGAPSPDAVMAEARASGCAGVLLDTWIKGPAAARVDPTWLGFVQKARAEVGLVAVAGGLDSDRIARLRPLAPDLFAVRGAACRGGDRRSTIDARRVAELVASCRGDLAIATLENADGSA